MRNFRYLVGAGDNFWSLSLFVSFAMDHCFHDSRVVGAQIYEYMGYASLVILSIVLLENRDSGAYVPQSLKEGPSCCIRCP